MKTINKASKNKTEINNELRDFIKNEFIKDESYELSFDYPLLENGIIDSLSMMTLIIFAEKQYNLDFYNIQIKRDDFKTINSISEIIFNNI